MKKVKVKKLFIGHVSIRDYIVEKCLQKKQGIVVNFKEKSMTILYEQLKNYKQLTKDSFQSKFKNITYKLYDFPFIPDELNKKHKELKCM